MPELVLARADMALYRAKAQGRGNSCFFEQSMDEETRLRRTLAFQLRDAIAENQLELYYHRSPTSRPTPSSASRRWCAGTIPSTA